MKIIKNLLSFLKIKNKKKASGYPGQQVGRDIYCPLYDDWIGIIVPCSEICDERGDYLRQPAEKSQSQIIRTASTFNHAAKAAGFKLPRDIDSAVNICLFCEAYCHDGENVKIPPPSDINRSEALNKLYG